MPEKDPTNFTLITYAWVLFLSTWGGLVSFFRKVKTGETKASNIMELVGELVTSAFAGVITFYLCDAAGIGGLISAVFVGISGHMGTRAIFLLERAVEKRLKGRAS